ncbi:MAG TPA: beta/gamma crystallin-related protein [Vicinamibacterales bacterium]|nr:beta/gamma crystallin-related protein [Vicinamibacterales bacterium]
MLSVLLLAPPAHAQRRRFGRAVGITVYEDTNFHGRSMTFRQDVPNMQAYGSNDKISSLRVAPGESWEICVNANYLGRCQIVSGDQPNLKRFDWNDTISSLRRVRPGEAVRRGGRAPYGPPAAARVGLVLFDGRGYRGAAATVDGERSRMGGAGRRVSSLQVLGGRWEVCDRPDFKGHCATVVSSVPNVAALGLNRIESVRPLPFRR